MSRLKPALITLLMLVLSGCGFHLRGALDMPSWFDHVAIIEEHSRNHLSTYLIKFLRSYHLTIETDPAKAAYWVVIEQNDFQEQVTSVSSSTTPRQYQLTYTIQFKLMQPKGKELISSAHVVVSRQVTLNSDRILGSSQEEDLLKNEMRREAAIQILNRISREAAHIQMTD